jgi:asparagine synthase (glutamine-hydrolysing)
LIVDKLGAQHVTVTHDQTKLRDNLYRSIYLSESPLKETYNVCSLMLSEAVKNNGVKVVLSGEGADELFGGYFGYRFDTFRNKTPDQKSLEDLFEEGICEELWGDPNFFYELNQHELRNIKRGLFSSAVSDVYDDFDCLKNLGINKARLTGRDSFSKRSYLDFKLRLADHLISDHCDRVNYANSIEGRYPFLDIDLVEFAMKIPSSLKVKLGEEKYILKKMAARHVPSQITSREKFGWVSPGSPELLRDKAEWVLDLLSYDRIKRDGYFDPDAVEILKARYSQPGFDINTAYESDLLIVVITFNIFLDLFNAKSDFTLRSDVNESTSGKRFAGNNKF